MSNIQYEEIILLSDPRVLATPIVESGEELVDLRLQNAIKYGISPEVVNNQDYTYLRKTVYEKLLQAQQELPKGYRFCLYEGLRTLELQNALFTSYRNKIQKEHPNLSEEKLFNETTKLVAPVVNLDGSHNIPPHSTGGAIDIYLVDDVGKPHDMGILIANWQDDLTGNLSRTDSAEISAAAKDNRKIMNEVLLRAGFVNYPTEYWHWSYGDRYWAYHAGKSQAIYGTTSYKS